MFVMRGNARAEIKTKKSEALLISYHKRGGGGWETKKQIGSELRGPWSNRIEDTQNTQGRKISNDFNSGRSQRINVCLLLIQ